MFGVVDGRSAGTLHWTIILRRKVKEWSPCALIRRRRRVMMTPAERSARRTKDPMTVPMMTGSLLRWEWLDTKEARGFEELEVWSEGYRWIMVR